MFLVTTAIDEFIDKSRELLVLGPWCTPYAKREEWKGLKIRRLPNPWDDRGRFHTAVEYCRGVEERLLPRLSAKLNELHGTAHSPRYWRIALGLWPGYHIQQLYDHYEHVRDAERIDPEFSTICLDLTERFIPFDFEHFLKLSTSDAYHLRLFSYILSRRRPGLPSRNLPPERRPQGPLRESARKRMAREAAAIAVGLLRRAGFGRTTADDLYLDRRDEFRLFCISHLRILPLAVKLGGPPAPLPQDPESRRRRQSLADIGAEDDFERMLVESLPDYLPSIALEFYPWARRRSLRFLGSRPELMATAVGWLTNEAFKFSAAECAASGTRLWGMQHGGGYGMLQHHPAEPHERAVSDRYWCWGWSSLAREPKAADLPHPKLWPRRVSTDARVERIIYTTTAEPLHTLRLGRGPIGGQGLEYLEWQARFLSALPSSSRARLLARLYQEDYGWAQEARLKDRFPDLTLDDPGTPFQDRLREPILLVTDHPGTTLLQGLAADVPTVAFWDPRYWEERPEARPLFDRLRDVGILHDSPETAANQAAVAAADAGSWWNAPKTRSAREAFRATFAAGEQDWTARWIHELTPRRNGA